MRNIIILFWEKGLSNDIYDILGLLGIVFSTLFCVLCGKKYGVKTKYMLITVLAVLATAFFSIHIIIIDAVTYLNKHSSVSGLIMTSIIRVFLLIPMTAFWLGKMLKIQWAKLCDILAFLPLAIGSIGAFGCLFTGCCRGYPCSWGIYNPRIETVVFPIQIFNAIIMFAIMIYLYVRAKRRNFNADGLSYPLMLVLFGLTRFVTEFFTDNDKILLGCSVLAIHALKDLMFGLVAVFMIRRSREINRGNDSENVQRSDDCAVIY